MCSEIYSFVLHWMECSVTKKKVFVTWLLSDWILDLTTLWKWEEYWRKHQRTQASTMYVHNYLVCPYLARTQCKYNLVTFFVIVCTTIVFLRTHITHIVRFNTMYQLYQIRTNVRQKMPATYEKCTMVRPKPVITYSP